MTLVPGLSFQHLLYFGTWMQQAGKDPFFHEKYSSVFVWLGLERTALGV